MEIALGFGNLIQVTWDLWGLQPPVLISVDGMAQIQEGLPLQTKHHPLGFLSGGESCHVKPRYSHDKDHKGDVLPFVPC